jgi:hypothetical protein
MVEETGVLGENHWPAARYLVQKLRENEVQSIYIMQISGHNNINSVNSYSSISENKQREISNILSNTRLESCDQVCQWRAAGQWFSPGTPVFSTNKTDHHDITEILLRVALNTIALQYPWLKL